MKQGYWKKAGSILLTGALVFSAFPNITHTVYAQEETEITQPAKTEETEQPTLDTTPDVETPAEESKGNETEGNVDEESTTAEPSENKIDEKAEDTAEVQPYAEENNAGAFHVTGGTSGSEWTYDSSNNTLTFNTSGIYTVTGNGTETTEKIIVSDNFNGTITIKDVNIKSTCAFEVKKTANLTLMLEGKNTLISTNNRAGLQFGNATTGSLTIGSETNGTLTATGGDFGAGIGGGDGQAGSNITINGGTIIATGDYGAGIGGGWIGSVSYNIIINGGTITATSYRGAGIGGGYGGSASNIKINDGSVKASSIGTTPTNKDGNHVYLAKVANLSGIDSVTVDKNSTFTRDGNHPDNDDAFYLYLTEKDHIVKIGDKLCPIKNYNKKLLILNYEFVASDLTISTKDKIQNYGYDTVDNRHVIFGANSENNITVAGNGTEVNEKIFVDDFNGTILLENVNLSGTDEIISLGTNTHLTLKFDGVNTLLTTGSKATISTTSQTSSLTFDSDTNGVLNVTSKSGVAIGSMKNTYNITFNGGTINATGSSSEQSDIGVALYGNGEAKNIVVNGGTVNCLKTALGSSYGGNKFYSISCQITINGGTVTAPVIGGSTFGEPDTSTKVIINGGSVKGEIQTYGTLTDSENNPVYLAKLENLSGVDSVTVDDTSTYKRAGDHPNDNAFYLYLPEGNHTISVNGKTYQAVWNNTTSSFKVRQPASTPKINVQSKTATSITVQPLADTGTYGEAEYKINDGKWQSSNEFTNLTADKEYTVYARYKGNDSYLQSEAGTATVRTKKDGKTLIENKKPSNLKGVYEQKLSDVALTSGWTWTNNDTVLSVGQQNYPARFATKDHENDYDFTGVSGYNADYHYVEVNLTVDVSKANTSLTITTENMDKAYDGQAVASPKVEIKGNTNSATFTWYVQDGQGWKKLDEAPVNVGSYNVIATVDEDDNYKKATAEKKFNISKTTNEWTQTLSITGWTYGQEANTPTATAKYGTVTFSYSDKQDGTYTDKVPTNAGTWYVKAIVAGNENYTELEKVKKFTIAKADSTIHFHKDFSLDKQYDGKRVTINTTNDMMITGSRGNIGFSYERKVDDEWKLVSEVPKNAGTYRVTVTLYEDRNYQSAKSETLVFTIRKAETTLSITENMDKKYDGKPVSEPKVDKRGSSKEVAFTWYQKNGSEWNKLDKAPTNAGSYKVAASVAEDTNYNGTADEQEFTIEKATPEYTLPTNLTITQGKPLSELDLSSYGFVWNDAEQTAEELGDHTFKAIFIPEDEANYKRVEAEISVHVVKDTAVDLSEPQQPAVDEETDTDVETSAVSYIGLWGSIAMLSAMALLATMRKKCKKTR